MPHDMIVTISKGQQITIPANMREMLGLDIGSKVDVEYEDGKIIINPVGEELETIFKAAKKLKPKHNLTAKQMDEFNERMFR